MGIRAARLSQEVRRLSGGNQQKVVLARWLSATPTVMILDEPTRGIDIGARKEIYEIIRGLADDGMTIVLISSDLTEVVGLADHVIALRGGRLVADLPGGSTESDVLRAIV
jgi:ABC-type sugar transport system ATPase subunit